MKDPLTILIIDEMKRSCEEMHEFLMGEGVLVIPALSVEEGHLVLMNSQIDILILDINMSDANGIRLIKEFKSRYPNLDVIVITEHGNMDSAIQTMRLRVLDILMKPLQREELLTAIERSQKMHKSQLHYPVS